MSNEPGITTIQRQYAEKIAADLESNTKEQEEVRSQMAALQARLDRLEADRTWLSGVQDTLTGGAAAPEPPADSLVAGKGDTAGLVAAAGAVPRPRQAKNATVVSGKRSKKTAQAQPDGAAKAATIAKPAKRAQPGGKKDGPPLRVFVMEVLQDYRPRTAAEIADDITQAHPDRTPDEKVVRNTVNTLIAKGNVGREKQGINVYYTALKKEDESPADASAGVPVEPVPVDA
ncbi:BlaI/MecI/CopY family transcriptional regulator [Streptomyces sp. NPDC059373]